jgi:hypothetical protein
VYAYEPLSCIPASRFNRCSFHTTVPAGTEGLNASKNTAQLFHEAAVPVRIKTQVVDRQNWPESPVMINFTNLEALPTEAENMGVVSRINDRVTDFVSVYEASMAVICIVHKKDY